MPRPRAIITVGGLVMLLMAVYLPATAVLDPVASPVSIVGGAREPTSTVDALDEFSRQVVTIDYLSNGTAGLSGVFWTELWYQRDGGAWTLYRPPWNSIGQWAGVPLNSPMYVYVGTILFDTYFTGGDARYNFTTVAVDRGFYRETGPSPDDHGAGAGHAKARTIVDTIPPNVFLAKPAPNSWTNSELLAWSTQDATSGIASVQVAVDGGAFKSYTETSGQENMTLSGPGDHAVTVRAVDRAGNENNVTVPFHYDPSAPTLQITSPAPNSYANATSVDVQWTLADVGSGIASLQLSVDSNTPVSLGGTATHYGLAGLAESGHVLNLLALDYAGNLASQTVSFGVDATPPALAIASPTSGALVNTRQLQALWSASDAGSGIAEVLVSLDGGDAVRLTNAAGYTFPTVSEGNHRVTVKAVDRAGNVAEASSTVTVDATPPTVTIEAPATNTAVSGAVSLNWTASDSGTGIGQVFVFVDGGSVGTPSPASVSETITPLAYGIHSATVRVFDRAGNMAEATVAFNYVPAGGPGPTGLPAIDFWILMLIIGAIAIGSAYYAVRRRKKSRA